MVATVGSIQVSLDADLRKFSASLSQGSAQVSRHAGRMRKQVNAVDQSVGSLSGRMARFSHMAGTSFRAISAIAATASAAMTVAVKRQITQLDKLAKTSQAIGVPVEELSRLAHAAELSGVSFDDLTGSVGKLSKSMSDALRSATSEQAQAFKALGISLTNTDGSLRNARDVLGDVADRFSRFQDGAGKSSLAMAIFGRSGRNLIPLLNQGAEGLQEMGDEAERLGIVVDTKTAKAAERFNDNLTRVKAVAQGLVTRITARLLPAMEALSVMLLTASENSGSFQLATDAAAFVMKALIQAGIETVAVFRELDVWSRAIGESFRLSMAGKFSDAVERLKAGSKEIESITADTAERVAAIWNAQASPADGGTVTSNLPPAPTLSGGTTNRGKSDADRYADIVAKAKERITQLGIEQQALSMTAVKAEELRFKHDLLNDTLRAGITLSPQQRTELEGLASRYSGLAAGLDNARQSQERMNDLISDLDQLGSDALQNLIDGTFSWKDALRQVIPLVQKLLTGTQGGTGFIGQAIGGLLGVTQFHEGGIAGIDGMPRAVPAITLAGAPRFHNGLKSNEMAAILEKGEAVLTAQDQKAMTALANNSVQSTYAPVYNIDARGSNLSEADFKRVLEERDREMQKSLGPMAVERRSRGAKI